MASDQNNAIILHQYDISPFSEKVRVILGLKGLSWYACEQPVIMPKPELTPLTGGYRRIPVMQIGADIYCDTQIIIRELERRFPSPSIFVGGDQGIGYGLGFWTDRILFQAAVGIIFGGIGDGVDDEFKKDREAMMGRPFDTNALKAAAPMLKDQLRAQLGWVEDQLADGRSFLFGDRAGLSDASVYYNLAFIRWLFPDGAAVMEQLPKAAAWEERVKAIGHGNRSDIGREEALDIAKAATSVTETAADPNEPNGFKPGDAVTIMADDYGQDPIAGTIVSTSAQHIAITRNDPRVGDVTVHFPRAGFVVLKS